MSQKFNMCRRAHFIRRVRERVSPKTDGAELWSILIEQMAAPDPRYLRFVARLTRGGRRLWRFWLGGRWHFLVFDHANNHPITILVPGRQIKPEGKHSFFLRDDYHD
ncbi:hypothetical protein [Sediminimonas sp.]|uniref:hypothetical protein n=1 Tax=Sediminimonas sp. TaxID=2823379 RepID=UPI0025CC9198|nr:hypothetical protein [Sediminimonas sp.]